MKTALEILSSMTLEQKAKLFTGKNYWEIEEIDGKSVFMSDGPHGLRKEVFDSKNRKSNREINQENDEWKAIQSSNSHSCRNQRPAKTIRYFERN